MSQYADGDDRAFAVVFEILGPRLLRFLRRLSGSDALAQDLLQDTLLRIHQARGSFRPGASVLPWAFAIARNVFLDSARARKRSPIKSHADDADTSPEPVVSAEAESHVLAREAARVVERALMAMSSVRREAFVLVRFEGLSIVDAAEVLGTTPNAVKLRAFQAYEVIREELARLGGTARPLAGSAARASSGSAP
ncbi:MAG TPA: RNA polymerase sigma factor [Polyangiaceae bacterium]|nr:RNA polymerase sigma factor [Polyangiaceae bacterium]